LALGDSSQLKRLLGTDGESVLIPIFVQPRASKTRIVGVHDGMLKVAVAAPPVDGTANKVVVSFLARTLGVRKADLSIRKGEKGRRKTIAVLGLSVDVAAERLG
jgi:uncharacterized protein (TIGR00251 family)